MMRHSLQIAPRRQSALSIVYHFDDMGGENIIVESFIRWFVLGRFRLSHYRLEKENLLRLFF